MSGADVPRSVEDTLSLKDNHAKARVFGGDEIINFVRSGIAIPV